MRLPRILAAAMLLALPVIFNTVATAADKGDSTVYTIKKGDTLWGLSSRFLNDPYYWPDLWAKNPEDIQNPHFIFPGQRLRIYPDRIEIEPAQKKLEPVTEKVAEVPQAAPQQQPVAEQRSDEQRFIITGGEGFLAPKGFSGAGSVIAGQQGRHIYAVDDVVYTDIGRLKGGKAGDRFSIYKQYAAVSHPVTNLVLGYKVIPLGALQLTEIAEKSSKALINETFLEVEPGAILLPYKNRKREISLKAADADLTGYIVETRAGIQAIAAGDIAYIDLGEKQGVKSGNMLYVVRNPKVDLDYFSRSQYDLPVDVIGAIVVVDTAENSSTALVVKSVDTIYKGDRLEMKKVR